MFSNVRKVGTPIHIGYYFGETDDPTSSEVPATLDGMTAFEAARSGQVPLVACFVYAGFPLESKDSMRGEGTLLHYAAAIGDVGLVTFLLQVGADVNSHNGLSDTAKESVDGVVLGQTPLFWAAHGGHVDVIKTLVRHGADVALTDRHGHTATHPSLSKPITLHLLASYGIPCTHKDESQRTLLHDAAADGHKDSIFYLVEIAGLPVDGQDCAGDTPLHLAARRGEVNAVKALLGKGASLDIKNTLGQTPAQCASATCSEVIASYCAAVSTTEKGKVLVFHESNLAHALKHPKVFIPTLLAITIPNITLYTATKIHPVLGFFCVFGLALMMAVAAKVQSSSRYQIVTPGWFLGALGFGTIVLSNDIFPLLRQYTDHAGAIIAMWYLATFFMLCSYFGAVFADPGIVPSTSSSRRELYDAISNDNVELDKHDFCVTCLIRKPHRSKHCSVTGHCVYRFDHYCVWTGNAVGGGNHRPFYFFLIGQFVSQAIVMYTTCIAVFVMMPSSATSPPSSLMEWIPWLFRPETAIITNVLLVYNAMVFMFMFAVLVGQTPNIGRNLTSNEAWFPSRYRWLFLLGKRVYSLYDNGGTSANWRDFLFGNLCAEHYQLPAMNDYLQEQARKFYSNTVNSYMNFGGAEEGSHGHSHGGGGADPQQHHHQAFATPTTDASAASSNLSGNVQELQQVLHTAQASLPDDKKREMRILQHLLRQVTTGATDITLPDDVVEEKERVYYYEQLETMRERHRQMMASLASLNMPAAAAAAVGSSGSKDD